MDAGILLTIGAIAALAATLTLAVYRTVTRPAAADKFEDAIAKLTSSDALDADVTLSNSSASRGFSWNGYWMSLFERSGRTVNDPQSPGRIMIGILALATFFGVVVFPGGVPGILAPAVAVLAVNVWLSFEKGKRRANLDKQLPLLLSALRGQMQAGLTVQGAILSIADDLPAPLGDEIRQVKADIQVAVPVEQALTSLAGRTNSRLMNFLVASMGIAIRSGADLVPQLVVIEETVRQRARIEGKIKSAIALAKPTSYIAMASPLLVGGWLFMSDPAYANYYFGPDGFIMSLIILIMYSAGVVTVRIMMSNVEKV
jgi:tight adherence protein B